MWVVGNRTESGTEKEGRSRNNVFLFKLLNSLEAFDFAGGGGETEGGGCNTNRNSFLSHNLKHFHAVKFALNYSS